MNLQLSRSRNLTISVILTASDFSITFCPTVKHTSENKISYLRHFLCYKKFRLKTVLYSKIASVKGNFAVTALNIFSSSPPISFLFSCSNLDCVYANI